MDALDLAFAQVEEDLALTFKPEQRKIVAGLVGGNDTVAILPTGYGKSLCYAAVPLVLNQLEPEHRHMAVVVSPLLSLIANQVQSWSDKGVSCAAIGQIDPEAVQKIKDGVSLLFCTPEAITSNFGRELLSKYKATVCLLAYDEAHCIHEWGTGFRPQYREVAELRSLVCGVPVGVYTATCTQEIVDDIITLLLIDRDTLLTVAVLPDR